MHVERASSTDNRGGKKKTPCIFFFVGLLSSSVVCLAYIVGLPTRTGGLAAGVVRRACSSENFLASSGNPLGNKRTSLESFCDRMACIIGSVRYPQGSKEEAAK